MQAVHGGKQPENMHAGSGANSLQVKLLEVTLAGDYSLVAHRPSRGRLAAVAHRPGGPSHPHEAEQTSNIFSARSSLTVVVLDVSVVSQWYFPELCSKGLSSKYTCVVAHRELRCLSLPTWACLSVTKRPVRRRSVLVTFRSAPMVCHYSPGCRHGMHTTPHSVVHVTTQEIFLFLADLVQTGPKE